MSRRIPGTQEHPGVVDVEQHRQRPSCCIGRRSASPASDFAPEVGRGAGRPQVDASGSLSFAEHAYRVGNPYKRMSATVTVVGGTEQVVVYGQLVRTHPHPIRPDQAKEHGAFANSAGRPDQINTAPPRTLTQAV